MSFDDDFTSWIERKLYQEQVKFRLKRFSIDFFLISPQKTLDLMFFNNYAQQVKSKLLQQYFKLLFMKNHLIILFIVLFSNVIISQDINQKKYNWKMESN
jgi:hypothetical protein